MRPLGPSTPPKYLATELMVLEMSIVVKVEEAGLSTPMLLALRHKVNRWGLPDTLDRLTSLENLTIAKC